MVLNTTSWSLITSLNDDSGFAQHTYIRAIHFRDPDARQWLDDSYWLLLDSTVTVN